MWVSCSLRTRSKSFRMAKESATLEHKSTGKSYSRSRLTGNFFQTPLYRQGTLKAACLNSTIPSPTSTPWVWDRCRAVNLIPAVYRRQWHWTVFHNLRALIRPSSSLNIQTSRWTKRWSNRYSQMKTRWSSPQTHSSHHRSWWRTWRRRSKSWAGLSRRRDTRKLWSRSNFRNSLNCRPNSERKSTSVRISTASLGRTSWTKTVKEHRLSAWRQKSN